MCVGDVGTSRFLFFIPLVSHSSHIPHLILVTLMTPLCHDRAVGSCVVRVFPSHKGVFDTPLIFEGSAGTSLMGEKYMLAVTLVTAVGVVKGIISCETPRGVYLSGFSEIIPILSEHERARLS